METYIKPKSKTDLSLTNQPLTPKKIFAEKRALIGKKFVNRRMLLLVLLFSFAYVLLHVLVIRHLPVYAIVPIEIVILVMVWIKFYQILFDLKLLFFFNNTYDAKAAFPAGKEYPTISFIVPSYHEPFLVAKMTFDSIVKAPYKGRKDIIMVDNSRDTDTEDFISLKNYVDTYAMLHPEENVTARFIYNTEKGKLKPGNLDLGWLNVEDSEFVVILDIDSTLPAHGNLLEKAVAEFIADGKLGFLQFTIRATNNHFNDLTQSVAASQNLHRMRLVSRSYGGYKIFEGHNGMWRSSVLEVIGTWTDYYKGNIMVTEDILKSSLVYANGYYGKSLNIPTGEWVPCSLNALEGMWMRWTYGTSQVLFKYFKQIYCRYVSVTEKFDITYHVLNNLLNGFVFPIALLFQWFMPGMAANLFLLIGYVLPQVVGIFTIYFTSVTKLDAPFFKRIRYVYSAFFLVDTFIMLTQLRSTINFLVGVPQGWKVTAKGVESRFKWKELLFSKSFHILLALTGITVCLVSWVVHFNASLNQLWQYALLLFMSINTLLCIALFGKDRHEEQHQVGSAVIDGPSANTIDMQEYQFDVA